jgi:hypothetical protein
VFSLSIWFLQQYITYCISILFMTVYSILANAFGEWKNLRALQVSYQLYDFNQFCVGNKLSLCRGWPRPRATSTRSWSSAGATAGPTRCVNLTCWEGRQEAWMISLKGTHRVTREVVLS